MKKTETRLLEPGAIKNRILSIRGVQVMIDRDLAEFYGVETKRLNEQVKRNGDRFPERFCFQLSNDEKNELVANCDRFNSLKHSTVSPFAFTEPGVAMLASVLRSDTAVSISIQIIDSFVVMRKIIADNLLIYNRLDRIERKQLEADKKFEMIFAALDNRQRDRDKGIFYDGQVFDAYTFVADVIRKASSSIILVDNYVDDTVLSLFTKRKKGVSVTVYTKTVSKALALDLDKHNAQYEPITIHQFGASHDRFIILDDIDVYHIGASLKDLGKKWFAFSKMNAADLKILERL